MPSQRHVGDSRLFEQRHEFFVPSKTTVIPRSTSKGTSRHELQRVSESLLGMHQQRTAGNGFAGPRRQRVAAPHQRFELLANFELTETVGEFTQCQMRQSAIELRHGIAGREPQCPLVTGNGIQQVSLIVVTNAQVQIMVGILGRQLHGALETGLGFAQLPQGSQFCAQVGMSWRLGRVQQNRLPEALRGLFSVALFSVQCSQAIVDVRHVGLDLQCAGKPRSPRGPCPGHARIRPGRRETWRCWRPTESRRSTV